jgi:hypothetical protein
MTDHQRRLKDRIANAIGGQGVSARLSDQMACRLVFKVTVDEADPADGTAWAAIGQLLLAEIGRLKDQVGLADRQIMVVLPKVSALRVEELLDELQVVDWCIARTIFNAALKAADPITTGRRYLAEYQDVVKELQPIDPSVARTLANAAFAAGASWRKAMEHFKQSASRLIALKNHGGLARLPAKAAFQAQDPVKAAWDFIGDYNAAFAELVSGGVEWHLARTLASSSRFRRHVGAGAATRAPAHVAPSAPPVLRKNVSRRRGPADIRGASR